MVQVFNKFNFIQNKINNDRYLSILRNFKTTFSYRSYNPEKD